ncbi:LOW QUALITY PROTEIN: hypothetical protein Cgig2_015896 [Carnegiea gigantea]|uniref:Uncharacterized protein n=1 Tax=Carnegiea gigantea TaxID=171969 RepID=A0A9Q1JSX2_9CARY|nr:LOW QUALITY PROTEIN: hypothetical protein Cgig2_015896 [Carnegiea gigantea]
MITGCGSLITVPTTVLNDREGHVFNSSHNDLMVVELKVANALVRQILINAERLPQETQIPRKGYHTSCALNPRFRWKVTPLGMIYLPLRFGDKIKSQNLEVDFLEVDVPTAYNVISGCPTLHKVKAVIASYLLQFQYEVDDGSVGKLFKDQ